MAATPTYRIIRVPNVSSQLAELVTKSRTTRLHALKTDPTAFLARHDVEEALPMEVWHKRLTNPDITVLVCVATHDSSLTAPSTTSIDANKKGVDEEEQVRALLEGEWIAVAALRSMKYEEYYASPGMCLPVPEHPEAEARWHVFDLYTLPSHRGRGIAKQLVKACIATALSYSKGSSSQHRFSKDSSFQGASQPLTPSGPSEKSKSVPVSKARIRLFMNPKNVWLIKVYEGMGFVAAGKVTLTEGFRANCMDESLPVGTEETEEGRAKWHTRFGMAMEQVVDLS